MTMKEFIVKEIMNKPFLATAFLTGEEVTLYTFRESLMVWVGFNKKYIGISGIGNVKMKADRIFTYVLELSVCVDMVEKYFNDNGITSSDQLISHGEME